MSSIMRLLRTLLPDVSIRKVSESEYVVFDVSPLRSKPFRVITDDNRVLFENLIYTHLSAPDRNVDKYTKSVVRRWREIYRNILNMEYEWRRDWVLQVEILGDDGGLLARFLSMLLNKYYRDVQEKFQIFSMSNLRRFIVRLFDSTYNILNITHHRLGECLRRDLFFGTIITLPDPEGVFFIGNVGRIHMDLPIQIYHTSKGELCFLSIEEEVFKYVRVGEFMELLDEILMNLKEDPRVRRAAEDMNVLESLESLIENLSTSTSSIFRRDVRKDLLVVYYALRNSEWSEELTGLLGKIDELVAIMHSINKAEKMLTNIILGKNLVKFISRTKKPATIVLGGVDKEGFRRLQRFGGAGRAIYLSLREYEGMGAPSELILKILGDDQKLVAESVE